MTADHTHEFFCVTETPLRHKGGPEALAYACWCGAVVHGDGSLCPECAGQNLPLPEQIERQPQGEEPVVPPSLVDPPNTVIIGGGP